MHMPRGHRLALLGCATLLGLLALAGAGALRQAARLALAAPLPTAGAPTPPLLPAPALTGAAVPVVLPLPTTVATVAPWFRDPTPAPVLGLPALLLAPGSPPATRPYWGTPPFTLRLTAHLTASPPNRTGCQSVEWAWGDGTTAPQACQAAVPDATYAAQHTYTRPGAYTLHLRMRLTDGQTLTSAPQTVAVGGAGGALPLDLLASWLGSVLLVGGIGGALWWRAHRKRPIGRLAAALALLGLWTFVPPLSYAPNPLGLLWALVGGYSYDPRLPFVDRFLFASDPTAALQPRLDQLLGQTGLDPLDPRQPLVGYEFTQVSVPWNVANPVVEVTTRLTYWDGTQRTYTIPLLAPTSHLLWHQWLADGLERLRTEHVPLASPGPVEFALPQRLALSSAAAQLGAANPGNWLLDRGTPDIERLVWAPHADGFLTTTGTAPAPQALWYVPLTGGPPVLLAGAVRDYGWSPMAASLSIACRVSRPACLPSRAKTEPATRSPGRPAAPRSA